MNIQVPKTFLCLLLAIAFLMCSVDAMSKTSLKVPLDPNILDELGYYTGPPTLPEWFDPCDSWKQTYSYFTNDGYIDAGESHIEGTLVVNRTIPDANLGFQLKIDQNVTDDEGVTNTFSATINCLLNTFASPNDWSFSSDFSRMSSTTAISETAVIDGNIIDVNRDGTSLTWPGPNDSNYSADWCMLEAVQRLPFSYDVNGTTFTTFDNLSVRKENQVLYYYGPETWDIDGNNVTLYKFVQIGDGLEPYEYYLDSDHRLNIVITMSRAYILQSTSPAGLDTIWSDGFEDCFTNWTTGGAYCSTTSYEGAKSGKMDNTENVKASVSTSGYENVTVKYARKLDDMQSGDSFTSEWYDGSSWTTIETITSGFTDWTLKEFELAGGADDNANFEIRFKVNNTATNYAYVDSVEIMGE